jgi:phosphohistidine swiveling domain-containing protein
MDKKTEQRISLALKKDGLKFGAKGLLEFVKKSLEAREYSKFEFTKNLSDALELIAIAGERMGFTRQELALLDVDTIFFRQKDRHELTRRWKEVIEGRMEQREIDDKIVLAPIIFSSKDFDIVKYYNPRPNYITQQKISSKLVKIDNDSEKLPEIEGKIVMIENGDPGYDWIFTRNIAGLITKYGGVASHMSIRCAEFGIPAAIGCGVIFDQLSNADSAILDCASSKITPIRGDVNC